MAECPAWIRAYLAERLFGGVLGGTHIQPTESTFSLLPQMPIKGTRAPFPRQPIEAFRLPSQGGSDRLCSWGRVGSPTPLRSGVGSASLGKDPIFEPMRNSPPRRTAPPIPRLIHGPIGLHTGSSVRLRIRAAIPYIASSRIANPEVFGTDVSIRFGRYPIRRAHHANGRCNVGIPRREFAQRPPAALGIDLTFRGAQSTHKPATTEASWVRIALQPDVWAMPEIIQNARHSGQCRFARRGAKR
jgi:hypothetical protein